VLRLTGSRSRLAWRPLPADDPLRRKPDIGRAAYELQWQPRIGLDEGLLRTIAYFRRWAAHAPHEARRSRAQAYSRGLAASASSAAYSFNRL
jgi:hypothetical protein